MPNGNAPLSEKRIKKYLNMAKNVSEMSTFYKQHHLGAIFTYKNRVLSDGWNSLKSSPIQKEYNKYRDFAFDSPNNGTLHAEMMALVRCRDMDVDWSKVSVFVYREHADGHPALARCCPACMKALKDKGIKNIYYSTEFSPDGFTYERIG